MNTIVSTNALSMSYGGALALDSVTLDIEAGRIVGVLGPNGSGKTTLFKILAGLIRTYDGEALIDSNAPGAATKAVVSYLPERTYLADWMRPRDALALFSDYYADFDAVRARDMLTTFGLDDSKRVKQMSKGMQEKLQLILVLSRRARLYLLDEPLGGLDPSARAGMLNTILTYYNESAAMLIATHLIHDVESVFDRVVFLKDGRVSLDDDCDALRSGTGKSVEELFKEVFPWSQN